MIECKVCKNTIDPRTVEFKNMPLVAQNLPDKESLSKDYGINLNLCACPYCGVFFLDSEPVEYYREVIRAVGISTELKNAKYSQFKEFCEKYNLVDKSVIEIGCGNGEFLDILKKCAPNAFGIEYSIDAVSKCRNNGHNVYQGFISDEKYRICEERFSGFLLLMFLEHIPQPRSFLKGVYNNIDDDAVGIIEVPNTDMIFSKGLYAEIMRDHIYYYSQHSLSLLLNSCGFDVIEQNILRNEYVLSFTVKKRKQKQLDEISVYIEKVKKSFHEVFDSHNEVIIWGASHQTFFLLSQIGDTGKVSSIIDSADFKQGRYSPVTHIPILRPSDNLKNVAIIVSAGSYSEEIVNILRHKHNYSGDIYVFEIDSLQKCVF